MPDTLCPRCSKCVSPDDWGHDATCPTYDRLRGQPGSPLWVATEPKEPITYDWRHGSAVVRFRGRIIGLAYERDGVYCCALKIGSAQIDKAGITDNETHCGLKRLQLFIELWVSSVTASQPLEPPRAPPPPRLGSWLEQMARERA